MKLARRRVLSIALAATLAVSLGVPAAALAFYGAIAVNQQTAAWGYAYRAPTKGAAERRALHRCLGKCVVMVWVRNYCAAVVDGPTHFVAGIGATKKAAIRTARRRAHDSRAALLVWVCSG